MASFKGGRSDELLDREVFDTLLEAKVLIERWRRAYNTVRLHNSLGYRSRILAAPVRLLRLRLSKGTGANHWQDNPSDRSCFHQWEQVSIALRFSQEWLVRSAQMAML